MLRLSPISALLGSAFAVGVVPAVQAQQTALPTVEVIGATPIPGFDRPKDEVAANVQSVSKQALKDTGSGGLPELFGSQLQSVNVNEIQGNPYQADVNYRGFTASPLLGTPQGLSVYQDGVRVNEPFGDTVNWDLIPRNAIASIDLIPGSNPLFGLNTLGGALAIRTKDGFNFAGTGVEGYTGSFGRSAVTAEHGGNNGELGWYFTATRFKEDGWRDYSPSDLNQYFGKISHRSSKHELDLNISHAKSNLIGNGLTPLSFYEQDRSSIFTRPDNTQNQMTMVSLNGGYWLDDIHKLSGTIYARQNKVRTLNGDANDDFEDSANDGATGANGGLGIDEDTGVFNRTSTRQRGHGFSAQFAEIAEQRQYAFGTTYDRSRAKFRQSEQEGVLDATRAVVDVEDEEESVNIRGTTTTWSLFGTGTWKTTKDLSLTAAARYNHTSVRTTDNINPPGSPESLANDYTYVKVNPSLAAVFTLSPDITFYSNAQQGNRAPSPIELGCSNPQVACRLPNAMQADPRLEQVVTRSVEVGARGKFDMIRWNAAVFGANNYDDILFISAGATNPGLGYFDNFGKTRRAGLELGASADYGRFGWSARYTYLRATFESGACIVSEANSTAETDPRCTGDDEIRVNPGDRIPGIPEHSFKVSLNWRTTEWLTLGSDIAAYSGVYVRGNENNETEEGGKTAGFTVVNLVANADLGGGWTVFARMNNVFDKRYFTAGQLAENVFNANGTFRTNSDDWTNETFYAPGAPRAGWIGVRYRFGG
ncbi:TonB-dependent receptor [Methyloversatilis thermotolerans]|uniref:TonB-dependent receptor n=1 Tax=Methyloversatilis thermotolerans TaxID=1346290 RepID=UPI000368364C|nr:TonB-dependent receptor [Methyloversatilis thermotolerans]